jgi:hypothetical protein
MNTLCSVSPIQALDEVGSERHYPRFFEKVLGGSRTFGHRSHLAKRLPMVLGPLGL